MEEAGRVDLGSVEAVALVRTKAVHVSLIVLVRAPKTSLRLSSRLVGKGRVDVSFQFG